jgi:hypothetical protein
MERPKMRYYQFGFDPNNQSPVFRMMGYPHKLHILTESEVVDQIDGVRMAEVLVVMIKQAGQDFDPGRRYCGDNDFLFHRDMAWSGTPQRIAHEMRINTWKSEKALAEEPLPEHEHGDGKCEMEEFEGETTCKVRSRSEEIEHRENVMRERHEMEDPATVENFMNLLEEYHIVIPLRDQPLRDFLEGKALLEPPDTDVDSKQDILLETDSPSNVHTLRKHTYEGYVRNEDVRNVEEDVPSKNSPNVDEGKENVNARTAQADKGSAESRFGLLTPEAVKECLAAKIGVDHLRFLGTRSGCASAINTGPKRAAAAKTMIARAWFRPQFESWLENHPDECAELDPDSVDDI